ncbi:MAG TPA: hypothetical protein VEF89_21505 [Solirubrobacteraceae bacterium]|nr:hypothetical protein [Solirubrobacteraceae bacterium]
MSLAAGAASLGSFLPPLAHHLLPVALLSLVILPTVNLFGIGAYARLLMVPAALFVISVLAVIVVGPFHSKPVAVIGSSSGPVLAGADPRPSSGAARERDDPRAIDGGRVWHGCSLLCVQPLIQETVPRKPRHEILHNQRGRLLADALRARTDVAVTTLPFRLHD